MANNAKQQSAQQTLQQETQQQHGAFGQQQQQRFQYNPHATTFQKYTAPQFSNVYPYGSGSMGGYGTYYGYAGQAQTWYSSTPPIAPSVVPNSYQPVPIYPYNYTWQMYPSVANVSNPGYQPWPSQQQQYEQANYYAGWGAQQQPGYHIQQYSTRWAGRGTMDSWAGGNSNAMQDHLSVGSVAAPQTDRYRPAYTNQSSSSPRRRPLVPMIPGPPGRAGPPGKMTMQPVSSFVQKMADYERQYPKSPTVSDSDALSPNAANFIPGHRRLSDIEKHNRVVGEDSVEKRALQGSESNSKPQTHDQQADKSQAKSAQTLSKASKRTRANKKLASTDFLLQDPTEKVSQNVRDWMYRKTELTATPSPGHSLSTTDSSMSSPPAKRLKEEPIPSPVAECSDQNTAVDLNKDARSVGKGWGDYYAHIQQDDKDMVVKSRQDLERLGGGAFRPEIQETYKDQKGKTEIAVHEKVASSATVKKEVLDEGEDGDEDDGGVKI